MFVSQYGSNHLIYYWYDLPPQMAYKGQVIPAGSPKSLDGSTLDAYTATFILRVEVRETDCCYRCCSIVPADWPLVKPETCGNELLSLPTD